MIFLTKGIIVFFVLGLCESASNYASKNDQYEYTYEGAEPVGWSGCCQCKFNDTAYMSSACGNSMAFMTLLQTLIMSQCNISEPCKRAGTDVIPSNKWFDFIVVGAGVAGPVVARRLSDMKWRVLLVEAGPEEPSLTALPGLAFNAINSELDWKYKTQPSNKSASCLMHKGHCEWPRGKMVSGTGGMYGMMYARGSPAIYDEWERLGNQGWSYKDLIKYFERAENPRNKSFLDRTPFVKINMDTPMYINYFAHKPDFADTLLDAAKELDYNDFLKDGTKTGFMRAPMLTQDGLRGTTSRYYLRPVHDSKFLYVLTNAHVTKVITSEWDPKKALGIELINKEGKKVQLFANKEVILTAGAIGSPQILLQSGIGPKEDLEKLGIPVVKDLPVGKNLQNHVSVAVKMSINDTYYESLSLESVNQFIYNRTGPLSSTGLTQVTAFLASSHAAEDTPDIQVFFDGFSSKCVETGLDIECPNGSLDFTSGCPKRREIVARPTVVAPRSRGYLTLRSKNPLDHPLMYPNYFEDETDIKILIEGIRKVYKLTNTSSMKAWDLRVEDEQESVCLKNFRPHSDAYWDCVIRWNTGAENHQSGTCRMGPRSSDESVVDPELKVIGVNGLRVADASIFPVNTNANPVSAIVVVAEKVADMIINEYINNFKSSSSMT